MRDGFGQVVLLSGEAGIGKSTLLALAAREAVQDGMTVLTGAAYDHASAPPYGIWRDLFQAHAATGSISDLPVWLRSDPQTNDKEGQGTLFLDAFRFLAAVAGTSPILMIIEDIQWADSASLELLRYLARRVHHLPVLLAISYRADGLIQNSSFYPLLPDLIRECNADRIQLDRLGIDDIRQLVAGTYSLQRQDEERLAGYLLQHAEGVPLFTAELLRELADEQVIFQTARGWQVGELDQVRVPSIVRQMIEARLRRLDDNARALLTIAAVAGYDVSYDLWLQASQASEDELHDVVEAALSAGILVQQPDGDIAFSHALVSEALQSRVILPRRRSIHRNIAEALMARPDMTRNRVAIAYHLQQGRDQRAGEWLVQAGEQACAVYAHDDAINWLSAALEQEHPLDDTLRLRALRLRGMSHEIAGKFDAALADRQSALRIARDTGDSAQIWQALIDLGSLWAARDYRETREYYHQSLDLARSTSDPEMLAHSLNCIGNWHANTDRPVDSFACHQEALEIFRQRQDEQGIATTLDLLGLAAFMHGDMVASNQHFRDAARLFREQNDRRALASLLPTLMLTYGGYDCETVDVAVGTPAEALAHGEEGVAVAREIGWYSGESYALSHLGYFRAMQGEFSTGLSLTRQGLDLAMSIGHREWMVAGHYTLGTILTEAHAFHEAESHLTQAVASAQAMNSRYWARASIAGLARIYLLSGRVDAAGKALDQVLDADSGVGSIGLRQCWFRFAEVLLARNQPQSALDIAERLIRDHPGSHAARPVPYLEWLRGRALHALGQFEAAEQALHVARGRAEDLHYLSLLWRIDLDLASVARQRGPERAADTALERARQQVSSLAGAIDDPDLATEFRNAALAQFPEARQQESAATATGPALSPREIDVLRLVTRGMTDAEVGEHLYISPRTVGRHLQSIYNKLGVNSRTAAATAALERRLI